jgi:hypothetical protein
MELQMLAHDFTIWYSLDKDKFRPLGSQSRPYSSQGAYLNGFHGSKPDCITQVGY